MSEENKIVELNDEQLNKIAGGAYTELGDCKVYLTKTSDVVNAIRGLKAVLGVSLAEAKAMAESSFPLLICNSVAEDRAFDIQNTLENYGINCTIEKIVE